MAKFGSLDLAVQSAPFGQLQSIEMVPLVPWTMYVIQRLNWTQCFFSGYNDFEQMGIPIVISEDPLRSNLGSSEITGLRGLRTY